MVVGIARRIFIATFTLLLAAPLGFAQYRRELRYRFVAFGGIGGIAPQWDKFRLDKLLPSAGAGIRFKLNKLNHINYRADFGFGRNGYTVTLGVTGAF